MAAPLAQTLHQALQQALALYSARDWQQAEQVCRMILGAKANHFDALNLLGIIAAQTQRAQEAAELFGRAAAVNKKEPTVHNNYANVLRDLGRYEDALRSYNRAIQLKPSYPEAHYNRGVTLHQLKRFEDAVASYDRAVKLKPDYAAAFNNRGAALRELKRLDEAVASYDRAIALAPEYAAAYNNRGVALHELKRPQEALVSYGRALALNANNAEAFHNQGNALKELKRHDEALASFERALQINPRYCDACNGRGNILELLGRREEALACFEQAVQIDPLSAQAHYNRGNLLKEMNQHALALECFERALNIDPEFVEDLYSRGAILHELQRFEEAQDSYRRAYEINPDHPWLRGIILHANVRVCDWEGLDSRLADLSAQIEQGRPASPPFVVITSTDSAKLHRRAAEIWVQHVCPAQSALPPLVKRDPGPKLRIGYFSADYRYHATALLAAGLFERHDRQRFEVVAVNFGPDATDEMTQRLRSAFDQFVDVRTHSDVEIAQLSRDLRIDIAVDMKGYTLHQRPAIFRHRAAPIQVNYLGYPGSMGADFIDYIIADGTIIPDDLRQHYSEKVVQLPDSYQVNDRERSISERPWSRAEQGLPEDGFVFCSFNSAYKILPEMFGCWMRILAAVDSSVLWLLEDSAAASNNLRKAAERAGVDPARLVFAGRVSSADNLGRQRLADLFIDTWPCNAHTTASDALWAGLPVLTYAGESFPSRVAASLLNAVRLPELVTSSLTQYEALAIALASDRGRLADIRRRLMANRLTTPLFDTALYTQRIESAYQEIYRRYQEGLAPDHIRIP